MAACFLAHYDEVLPPELRPPPVAKACLQPARIFQSRQWGRLIWSAFIHVDEVHLCYNMASFLYKGVLLERTLGPAAFSALVGELLLLSHGLVVAAAGAAAALAPAQYGYLWGSTCAVGFSAVIFALKVVISHDAPGYSSVLGLTLPTKYLAWAELFLASVFNPQASFLGHLCGILAGLLHVKVLAPAARRALSAWRRARLAARIRSNPGQGRFAAPRRPPQAPAAAAGGSGPSWAGQQQQQQQQHSRPATISASHVGAAPSSSSASAAAAAAAAQQRIVAQQQRGIPARREQQGAAAAGGEGGQGTAAARPLTAEELRQRRLQRFA